MSCLVLKPTTLLPGVLKIAALPCQLGTLPVILPIALTVRPQRSVFRVFLREVCVLQVMVEALDARHQRLRVQERRLCVEQCAVTLLQHG